MNTQFDLTIRELSTAWHNDKLKELDEALATFLQQHQKPIKTSWLELLREGLLLNTTGLAEKLKVKRQAANKYELREKNGSITIETLQKIAEAYDCDFIYGFKPKEHSTFAEMLTEKALPFVQKPHFTSVLSSGRRRQAVGSRIQKFYSQPTGRGQAWKLKRALSRPYSWLWAGAPLTSHPHGHRRPN
jgi:transcriptional regulator with XRE-family HTH domain